MMLRHPTVGLGIAVVEEWQRRGGKGDRGNQSRSGNTNNLLSHGLSHLPDTPLCAPRHRATHQRRLHAHRAMAVCTS